MKRKKLSVEHIVAVLKQADLGMPCRRSDPSGRDLGTDVLSLEEGLRWSGVRSGARVQAAG